MCFGDVGCHAVDPPCGRWRGTGTGWRSAPRPRSGSETIFRKELARSSRNGLKDGPYRRPELDCRVRVREAVAERRGQRDPSACAPCDGAEFGEGHRLAKRLKGGGKAGVGMEKGYISRTGRGCSHATGQVHAVPPPHIRRDHYRGRAPLTSMPGGFPQRMAWPSLRAKNSNTVWPRVRQGPDRSE